MRPLALGSIIVVALTVRIYAAFFSGLDPYVFDSQIYMRVARAILDGSPIHSFPYGYPLLIALFLIAVPSGQIAPVLIGLNVLLSTAVVAMTFILARRLTGNERFALIVSAVTALYPHQIHYTRLIMTEVLCTFLLSVSTLLTLWPAAHTPKPASDTDSTDASPPAKGDEWGPSRQLIAGVVYYYSTAVRPSVSLTTPIIVLAGLRLLPRNRRPSLAILAGGYVATLLFFAGLEKINIVASPATFGNNVLISITSDSRNVVFKEFSTEEQKAALPTYLRFAVTKPGPFLSQRLISLYELWGPVSLPGAQAENRSLPVRFVVLTRTILLALALFAVWKYRSRFSIWVLFAPILGITLLHISAFSNHRFIAPIEPMLFILAGIGLWSIIASRHGRVSHLTIHEG